jgi:hypothetical protein
MKVSWTWWHFIQRKNIWSTLNRHQMLRAGPTANGEQQRTASRLWAQVGFSRTGDPATGDFHDATVLRKFGDVPDDLGAL